MVTAEELRALRAKVAAVDPDLVAAVDDVDKSLIESWLRKTPWERAALSFDAAAGIEELRSWRRAG